MPDIVLINPGAAQTIYQNLADGFAAVEPPTWVRMIGGWLRDHGYTVGIIDQNAERLSHNAVAERVTDMNPALVAIVAVGHQPSASTQQMTGASKLAEAIDLPTIMVGHHPSALPERTLREEDIEYVCDGEGPLTLAGLLDGLPLDAIPGLVWWDHETVRKNPRATLIPVDELHGKIWDLLPMDLYRAHNWQCLGGSDRQPYAAIYTTLGCPYKCSFCMINVFQHANRYRMRTPERVVEEIACLYETYGVTTIKIADEMFVLNERHVRGICEGLASKPFASELNIWAYARVDTVKPHMLSLMRKAGIRWLCLGIESGSAHVRDGTRKTIDGDEIREVVRAIQGAGINVLGNFIFGLPDDTQESMRDTLNLALDLKCEFVNFYSAMAYPGSKLFEQASPEDLPKSWSGYSQHSLDTTPLPTKALSSSDVLAFRDAAFVEYFTDPEYLHMIDEKFEGADEIKAMTAHRLERAA